MNKPLQAYLQNHFKIPTGEIKEIAAHFNPLTIDAGRYFLRKDKIADCFGFIINGVARANFTDDNGSDKTSYFFSENQFIGNLESYLKNVPSLINIQAVTKCNFLVIEKTDFEKLSTNLPVWSDIFNELVKSTLLQKNSNLNHLRNLSNTKEKYDYFVETNSSIALRVPLQYIASYLGITPQSLSRIRRSTK